MALTIVPIDFKTACEFVKLYHRHHKPPVGWKFGMGLSDGERLVGVAIVGRPVSRVLDDGYTLEVTRLCTDGTPHACSKLYAAAWRASRAMGYTRLITYTLAEEKGTSLVASGWKELYNVRGRSWNAPSRPRVDKHPTQDKTLWEVRA